MMNFCTFKTLLSIWLLVLVAIITPGLSVESSTSDNGNKAVDSSVSSGNNTAGNSSDKSGFPALLYSEEHLNKGPEEEDAETQQSPCEAGHPCRQDQWCSPSRQVCRPCSDIKNWCNDTDLVHRTYSACERYCYVLQLDRAVTCEFQLNEAQVQLRDTESALYNRTKALKEETEAKEKAILELLELRKREEENGSTIMGLTIAFALVTLMMFGLGALSVYLLCAKRQAEGRHRVGTAGETVEQPKPMEQANAPLITTEAKAPVQDNTMDSGEYCGNYGNPGIRVPGDAAVVA